MEKNSPMLISAKPESELGIRASHPQSIYHIDATLNLICAIHNVSLSHNAFMICDLKVLDLLSFCMSIRFTQLIHFKELKIILEIIVNNNRIWIILKKVLSGFGFYMNSSSLLKRYSCYIRSFLVWCLGSAKILENRATLYSVLRNTYLPYIF